MLIHLTCFQQFAISSVSDVFPVLLLLLLGEAVQQGLFFSLLSFQKKVNQMSHFVWAPDVTTSRDLLS